MRVGDEVEWTSQSAGNRRTKRGTVIRVLPDGARPDRLSANRFPGMARAHESYVVRANGKTYWPRVNQLRRANPAYEEKVYRILRDYQDGKFDASSGVAVGQLTIALSTAYDRIVAAVREESRP